MNFPDKAEKVGIIADALHYVKRYHGKTVVIKYGGNAMTDTDLQTSFAADIALLKLVGIRPVIVHGGGPQIDDTLKKIGKKSRFVDGLRYTDGETMDVVEMVLGGLVNKDIVRFVNKHGGRAVGLTGKDGGLLAARKMKVRHQNGEDADIGLVGEIIKVDASVLLLLQKDGFTPIIAPIGADEDGLTLNINADTAAAKIAVALDAEALFLLTNTAGVLDKKGELLNQLNIATAKRLIKSGVIQGGMRPKVECAMTAVTGGVRSCQIVDGTVRHALLLELFTNEGAGTFISV